MNLFIGDIAEQFLRNFASKSGTDKTFGFRDKDGKFYIGNKEAKLKENNIIVGPIWDEKDLYTGNGITPSVSTIILPCDPMALVERLLY